MKFKNWACAIILFIMVMMPVFTFADELLPIPEKSGQWISGSYQSEINPNRDRNIIIGYGIFGLLLIGVAVVATEKLDNKKKKDTIGELKKWIE